MDNDVKTIGRHENCKLVEKGKTTSSEAEAAVKSILKFLRVQVLIH